MIVNKLYIFCKDTLKLSYLQTKRGKKYQSIIRRSVFNDHSKNSDYS